MTEIVHQFEKYWEVNGYRIINCQTCGFIHLVPVQDEFNLEQFYQEKYFREIKPFPYDAINAEFVLTQKELVLKNTNYLKIFQQVTEYLTDNCRSMLDIGCGNDLLTLLFETKGWQTAIVEPSRDAAEYLSKYSLTVYNQPIEAVKQLGLQDLSFVNMQFVLEHIRDPFLVLWELNSLMVTGGVIRICVPNDFSQGQLAYLDYCHERPHWVYLPDHINYFSFDSLSKLLRKAGFRELYRTTNFPLEFLLLGGINYYASNAERAKVGPFVSNFEASFINTGRQQVLDTFYESLAHQGLGRSIFMYAIKE
ncbi:MAG TPA: class I SAM-dependent methyltransferase [Bacillota bacterium]|nr:class I SAM-dependent methyltransferase [Bacillota bacterium]